MRTASKTVLKATTLAVELYLKIKLALPINKRRKIFNWDHQKQLDRVDHSLALDFATVYGIFDSRERLQNRLMNVDAIHSL